MPETTSSRDVILREEDFLPRLRAASRTLGGWLLHIVAEPAVLDSPGTLTRFAEEAHRLETFIDDVGGRQNRSFVTFGELLASVRGLALVKATGGHVISRLSRYGLPDRVDLMSLESELRRADRFLHAGLLALMQALHRESINLDMEWASIGLTVESSVAQRRLLPRNLDVEDAAHEHHHIAEIAGRFLKILETSRALDLKDLRPAEDLKRYVAEYATEERCRWYESAVHNIQSMYDTFVLRTGVEEEHPSLRGLRAHASVALHMLEMATGLMHFYQRHENDIRHEPAAVAISAVVSKSDVLDLAVNVCLRQAYLMVEGASPVIDWVLETFVHEQAVDLSLPEGAVLHARPLALVVQVARHFGLPLEISLDGETCSGNSLMSLIMLGGKHPRPKAIRARGDARMLRDLRLLFESGLGENGHSLPEELAYLRVRA